jgi:DNA-binding transcriptional ArsR family regulator
MSKELSGTTLKVYLHILRSGKEKIGVRELMRDLNMKSPSHAYYHLDKLVSLGLLEKKYGDYYLIKNIKIDLLKDYLFIGNKLIPRFLFYTTFFLTIFIFTVIFPRPMELYWYIALSSSLIGFIISLYESIVSWRKIS